MKIQPLSIVAVEGEGRVERWNSPVRRRLLSSWNSFQPFFWQRMGGNKELLEEEEDEEAALSRPLAES